MTVEIISMYEDLARKIWDKMVKMVGVHTVMVLIQRTVWITGQKYGEASNIKFDESGVYFSDLQDLCSEADLKLVLEEYFGTLVMILTRLVGREIAQKIINEMDEYLK